MFDSPILEVAIGLSFIYLILSLLATVLVEALIEWRQWRGRLLYAKLETVLGSDLVEHFYRDRRVAALASGNRVWIGRGRVWEIFGTAIPRLSATPTVSRRRAAIIAETMGGGRLPSYIPESVFADVVLGWLQGTGLPADLQPDAPGRTALPQGLAEMWQRLNRKVDGDQAALHQELVDWFKQTTERMSGEFRRLARAALLAVGVGLVMLLNADSLRIGFKLYQDPQLRGHLVMLAEQVETLCPDGVEQCPELQQQIKTQLSQGVSRASLGLLGWHQRQWSDLWLEGALPWALIGWAMTIVAIGLGADFWFATLQKLLQVRSPRRLAVEDQSSGAQQVAELADSPAPRSSESRAPLDIGDDAVKGLKGFQPLRFVESNVHAFWLAQFASLAYADARSLRESALLKHHALTSVVPLDREGTQAFVFRGAGRCIVAFRGTEKSLDDIVTDLRVRHKAPADWGGPETFSEVRLHGGFYQALGLVWEDLLEAIKDVDCPVWLTGHSLGGALAVLAACRLHHSTGHATTARFTVGGVYTFGQPRVGNAALVEVCDPALAQRIFRYVNASDVVPLLPPSVLKLPRSEKEAETELDYAHLGQVRFFDSSGRLHLQRTLWERIAEQLTPTLGPVLTADYAGLKSAVIDHAKQRVADHGIARYIECLERIDCVRALWAVADTRPSG